MSIPYSFAEWRSSLGRDFWADDPELAAILSHHGLSDEAGRERVARYGVYSARAMTDGVDANDRPGALPQVIGFDPWGMPDPMGVSVHPATKRLLAASLRAGAATEPDVLVRYGMAYLGAQVGEAGVSCPLACTDGFVRAVDELECAEEVKAAAAHIRMQAPGGPVHAAQFVTEAQGGSDAATNLVQATPVGDGSWRLSGNKFFCSNLPAQYWAVTARPVDGPAGPRGVALFMVPRALPSGEANGFRVERLKDKLGTRALPTAEITLDGAIGWPIGPLQAGLKNMVRIVLTTSRFWTGLAGIGLIRGAERVATTYAEFRHAFGGPIARFPLVAEALDTLRKDRVHMLAAAFDVLSSWQATAAAETAGVPPDRNLAIRSRVLVQLFKTWATRRSTQRVHDAIIVLGGNGIEERFSPLPRLLRDAVILETWEGPHGLLLSRGLSDLQRFGARDEPHEMAALLLPAGAAGEEVQRIGDDLAAVLRTTDERAQMLRFRDFTDDLLDLIGEIAWREVKAGSRVDPVR